MPMAKKRKKEMADEFDKEADKPQPAIPLNRAACLTCKSRKVKCEYITGSDKCKRCVSAGIAETCAPPPALLQRPARASNRGPSKIQKLSSALPLPPKHPDSHSRPSQPRSTIPPKRSRSHSITSDMRNSTRIPNQKPVPAARNLPIIDEDAETEDEDLEEEEEEEEEEEGEEEEEEEEEEDDLPQATMKSFGSTMVVAEAAKEAAADRIYKDEDSVVESDKEIIEFTSDIDDNPPAWKRSIPMKKSAPLRKKPGPKPKCSRAKTPCSEDDDPDPKTCEFTITAAVQGREGNLQLFGVQSTILLMDLRMQIAERLRCFPGLLQLCYRLSTDKPKASAISIQTDEQFTIFLSQMRSLIVPQRLFSGKISTRQLKPVTVIFEDGSQDKIVRDSQVVGSKKSTSKSTGAKSSMAIDSYAEEEDPERDERMAAFNELRKQWRCETHSKALDAFCWQSNNMCYVLSNQNMCFWAVEIVVKRATVDTKPANLYLHEARPRTRAPSAPPTDVMFGGGWYGPQHAPAPYIPQHPTCCHAGHQPLAPSQSERRSHPIEVPDVIIWCRFLDAHTSRNCDGVAFTPYGRILKDKGFIRLSQLTTQFFTVRDLAEWLDIPIGTAVLIMQYAQEDLADIKAGKLIIPQLANP